VGFSKIFLHPRFSNWEIKKTPLLKRVDFKIGFLYFFENDQKYVRGRYFLSP
jgi:hypothetical protein